jgi:hypothetical protein
MPGVDDEDWILEALTSSGQYCAVASENDAETALFGPGRPPGSGHLDLLEVEVGKNFTIEIVLLFGEYDYLHMVSHHYHTTPRIEQQVWKY